MTIISASRQKGQFNPRSKRSDLSFYLFFCFGFFALVTSACSTTARERLEARQNKSNPRAASYAAEGFMMDSRSPEPRPFRSWAFYYKNCALVSRNPYPDRSEYSCLDPY